MPTLPLVNTTIYQYHPPLQEKPFLPLLRIPFHSYSSISTSSTLLHIHTIYIALHHTRNKLHPTCTTTVRPPSSRYDSPHSSQNSQSCESVRTMQKRPNQHQFSNTIQTHPISILLTSSPYSTLRYPINTTLLPFLPLFSSTQPYRNIIQDTPLFTVPS